jgi:hypothetical protein
MQTFYNVRIIMMTSGQRWVRAATAPRRLGQMLTKLAFHAH